MSRAVLLEGGRASLLLRDVECDQDGRIDKGYVVNGGWTYYCIDGEVRCCDSGNNVRNRFPDPGYAVFTVPADWRGGCNEIMARAEEACA